MIDSLLASFPGNYSHEYKFELDMEWIARDSETHISFSTYELSLEEFEAILVVAIKQRHNQKLLDNLVENKNFVLVDH